jgi:uncharacterized membrane protein YkvA (DUF1232 family)
LGRSGNGPLLSAVKRWEGRARQLKTETYALYLAYGDPGVPWYAKVLAAVVVAYAFSPIDLVPDFIPILGYLDDLVLVPLGIALVLRLFPEDVLARCRERARVELDQDKPVNWLAAGIIVALWLLVVAVLVVLVLRATGK